MSHLGHFWHFGLFHDEMFAGWASAMSLSSNLSLSGHCLLSVTSVAWGCSVLLHGGLPSMFHGGLSSAVVVSHGDLSSIYVG